MDLIFSKLKEILKSRALATMATLSILIMACQAGDGKTSDLLLATVEIDDLTLQLHSEQSQCAVQVGKSAIKLLSIPYPCGFVRAGKEQTVQAHYYEGIGHVLVVAGPLADKAAYTKDAGVSPEHQCSNHGQAIILHKGKLTLRKTQTVPLGFCHQLGFDEKEFYGYAYPVD